MSKVIVRTLDMPALGSHRNTPNSLFLTKTRPKQNIFLTGVYCFSHVRKYDKTSHISNIL